MKELMMMSTQKNVLVTSDHKKGRHAVGVFRSAYDKSKLDPAAAQILNEAVGFEEYLQAGIKRFSSKKHSAAPDIEKYFLEVFGITLDLSGVIFPEKAGFPEYMARPEGLDEDFVFGELIKHFNINQYAWMSPVAQSIDRKAEQSRPQGLYVFVHVGGDEPDQQHLGKSYDDATSKKMVFANSLEYLLMTGFHMWKYKKWMDAKGWTRTSSLWSDGYLVDGLWSPGDRRLCLGYGDRAHRYPDGGPRELFLG